jgi:hypothetical protein
MALEEGMIGVAMANTAALGFSVSLKRLGPD